jgi:hypothetical protein
MLPTIRITSRQQETLGLKIMYQPESHADVDIVAVRGLGGDSMTTEGSRVRPAGMA